MRGQRPPPPPLPLPPPARPPARRRRCAAGARAGGKHPADLLLLMAVEEGDEGKVEELLEAGADITITVSVRPPILLPSDVGGVLDQRGGRGWEHGQGGMPWVVQVGAGAPARRPAGFFLDVSLFPRVGWWGTESGVDAGGGGWCHKSLWVGGG